jgi:phage gp29-like protein
VKARLTAARKRSVKVRKNGKHAVDAASTMTAPLGAIARRITRQQPYRGYMMPGVAAMTPTFVETILRGALSGNHWQQWQLFDMMLDTWPELAACKQELLYGVTRRELMFDPYAEEDEKPTPDAIEREKVVTAALRNMRPNAAADENALDGTIEDLMDAWFRGISVLEIMWDTIDTVKQGTITAPRATAWVCPEEYGFSETGEVGLIEKASAYLNNTTYFPNQANQVTRFPDNKFLTAIHKVKSGSPLGGPLLRPLAWWWCAANFSSDWLLNLAQVFGLPFRWANYAASTPDQTVSAICDMLQNMGSAGWAAFPEGTTLELKEPSHGGGDRTPQGDLLSRADSYVRLLVLGQTMTGATLASGRGGQSFGTVEAQLKQDRLDAASFFVSNIINRQFIPYVLRLNYGNIDQAPTCRFLKETEGTYQDAQRDQILTTIGLQIPLSHLRHKYGIPEITNNEPATTPPPTPMAPSSVSAGPKGTRPLGEPSVNPAPNPKQVAAKLAALSLIDDDEVFARELRELASELVTQGDKPCLTQLITNP